jgi:hypothetical protein
VNVTPAGSAPLGVIAEAGGTSVPAVVTVKTSSWLTKNVVPLALVKPRPATVKVKSWVAVPTAFVAVKVSGKTPPTAACR